MAVLSGFPAKDRFAPEERHLETVWSEMQVQVVEYGLRLCWLLGVIAGIGDPFDRAADQLVAIFLPGCPVQAAS